MSPTGVGDSDRVFSGPQALYFSFYAQIHPHISSTEGRGELQGLIQK